MATINTPSSISTKRTHEGAPARTISPEQELRRTVMACLLWEDQFYESGVSIADRISDLVPQVDPYKVACIAGEARVQMHLRHVPLLLAREMARHESHRHMLSKVLPSIIQRPDELTEFLAIYWRDKKQPLAAGVKRGLAKAFTQFNEYQLAKYNRDTPIKLRDVLFLCHAKPENKEQEALWKRLIDGTLETPDTWEVELSKSKDKTKSWTRLLKEERLGSMALLRNLRNMKTAKVGDDLIRTALLNMKPGRVLPFRFIATAKHAMQFEPELEQALFKRVAEQPKLPGRTVLIVDVSGSMYGTPVSAKSELTRIDVACGLAMLAREQCAQPIIYATAGNDSSEVHCTQQVPPRRGFALRDAVYNLSASLGGGGIFLKQVMDYVFDEQGVVDRVIVITDEQDCDHDPKRSPLHSRQISNRNYLINVASYKNGIGYRPWTHIDGWSENVVRYIQAIEEK